MLQLQTVYSNTSLESIFFVFSSFSVRLCVYSLLWLKFGDKMQILTIISPSRKTRAFCNYVLLMAGWFCG